MKVTRTDDTVFVKCAWRLIPFIFILYLVNFIDRVNVGFAALTMNTDLQFSPAVYGFGAGILFAGYALFQVPSNLILANVGARRWMFVILLVWGVISASTAFVTSPLSFYIVRFFLGIAEAGFFPGMVLYLTYWFPKAFRARFVALFMVAIPFSYVVGGPLSTFILTHMDEVSGLRGWQWMFLIEGLPASLLAFVVLKFLPSGPFDAPWLTDGERQTIRERLSSEDTAGHQAFGPVLLDPRVYVLGIVYLGYATAYYGVQSWLPLIVQGMGFSNTATGFVVAAPFLIAMVTMVLWGQSSDRSGERVWHVAIPLILAAAGLLVASAVPSNTVVFMALTAVLIGVMSFQGPFWTLPPLFFGGSAAAGGIALINTIGTGGGGFVGPYIIGVFREATGDFALAMAVLALAPSVGAVLVLALKRSVVQKTALAE